MENITYPSLLNERAQRTTPHQQQINQTGPLDALLLADLATNLGSAPQVQKWHELGQGVHHTALAQLLGVLTEGVARAEIGDDACK